MIDLQLVKIAPLALGLLLVSGSASAGNQLSVSLGQTKVMDLHSKVRSVRVKDPSVLEVRKLGKRRVALAGKETGQTQVTVKVGRKRFDFQVYVTSGSEAYPVSSALANRQSIEFDRSSVAAVYRRSKRASPTALAQAKLAKSKLAKAKLAKARRAKAQATPVLARNAPVRR
jgi:Flp pilus assembly secretin CpaC